MPLKHFFVKELDYSRSKQQNTVTTHSQHRENGDVKKDNMVFQTLVVAVFDAEPSPDELLLLKCQTK